MTTPRLSTVYDNASLRLHQSGDKTVRVNQSSKNLSLQHASSTVQDLQGNWIARHAGGFQTAPKTRPTNVMKNEDDQEYINVDVEPTRPGAEDGNQISKANEDQGRNPRKRRRLTQDVDFLATSHSTALAGDGADDSDFLPLPSSDLLKCIHHFASKYYSEKGQLLNLTREYRQERKACRLAKMKTTSQDEHIGINVDEPADKETTGQDMNVHAVEHVPSKKRSSSTRKQPCHRRDMYKIMDGSALMAIGMLLQEHITHLLVPRIPDGWEESMEHVVQEETVDLAQAGDHELPPSTDPSLFDHESEQSSEDEEDDLVVGDDGSHIANDDDDDLDDCSADDD